MAYVGGEKPVGCVFCLAMDLQDDLDSLILCRGERAFIILNLFPYNSGHAMIVPYAHAASIEEVDPATRAEMFELANLAVQASRSVLRCDGFNLGMNLGEVAGAGVAEHIHLHVVPRWTGDASFMPILGNTMVMPELIPATYARLRGEIEASLARRAGDIAQAGLIAIIPATGEIVLWRDENGAIALPKTTVEPIESIAQVALREFHQKTGYRGTIVGWAGSARFLVQDSAEHEHVHHVSFLLATAESPAHVDDTIVLADIDEAAAMLDDPDLAALVTLNVPVLRRLTEMH